MDHLNLYVACRQRADSSGYRDDVGSDGTDQHRRGAGDDGLADDRPSNKGAGCPAQAVSERRFQVGNSDSAKARVVHEQFSDLVNSKIDRSLGRT